MTYILYVFAINYYQNNFLKFSIHTKVIVFVVLVVDLDSIHLSKLHSHLVKISHRQDCHE